MTFTVLYITSRRFLLSVTFNGYHSLASVNSAQDDKGAIERRNSFVSVPYHHNFDLQQLFDTCRVCITAVEQSLQSALHRPVLSRRLDTVDESFKSVSAEFSSNVDIPDNSSYLLIIILKEVYELLRDHVEHN